MFVIAVILKAAEILIIARVIISWVDPALRNGLSQTVAQFTDPILNPLSRYTRLGMLDFSPMIALIVIEILRRMFL